ncbi:HutD-family protein [Rhizobium sp. PDO1-076]|uniref:HutD/Ves family protein n=1 Tax=Rhizobium sp. PDO1-076 TaxID=1125979 RepID=UPI00024E377D|nr:HutD family protein [Rhizobium sp. PDO1-076]EHS51378.1 HutD-family protein [Rhizobium sp. PDO1-076]
MPSSPVLLKPSDYRRMPWKNGLGETIEIAVFPPDAGIGDFDWRISMATVASDGPFSLFPGIERTLSVLSGDGLTLHRADGTKQDLTVDSTPYAFPADEQVSATLLDGAITDLNVMTRRGRFDHGVERLLLDGSVAMPARENTVIVFCLRGQVRLGEGAGSATLGTGESLLFGDAMPSTVLVGHGVFFIIDLIASRSA